MPKLFLLLVFVFLAGCSRRVDGYYTFSNEWSRVSVDLRSDGTAVQESSFNPPPETGWNAERAQMLGDALTIKKGYWSLNGSRLTVSGKSVLGVHQSDDYMVEPNGDLVEVDGSKRRLFKAR